MGNACDLEYLSYLIDICNDLQLVFISKHCSRSTIEEIQRIFLHREVEYVSQVDFERGER